MGGWGLEVGRGSGWEAWLCGGCGFWLGGQGRSRGCSGQTEPGWERQGAAKPQVLTAWLIKRVGHGAVGENTQKLSFGQCNCFANKTQQE